MPCIGYVFSVKPPRAVSPNSSDIPEFRPSLAKIAVLGDTKDASWAGALAQNADVVVHEATYNVFPDGQGWANEKKAQEAAISRGHSTARMAGEFAAAVKAHALCLNHLSSRYAILLFPMPHRLKPWICRVPDPHQLDHKSISDASRAEAKAIVDAIREQALDVYSGQVVVTHDLQNVYFRIFHPVSSPLVRKGGRPAPGLPSKSPVGLSKVRLKDR